MFSKKQIKSKFSVNLCMNTVTTNFHENLLGFSEELYRQTDLLVYLLLTNFYVQKGHNPWEKSCEYAHLHRMSFPKFHDILLSGFMGVELTKLIQQYV